MWEFSGIFWQKFYKPMSPTHEVKRTKKESYKKDKILEYLNRVCKRYDKLIQESH